MSEDPEKNNLKNHSEFSKQDSEQELEMLDEAGLDTFLESEDPEFTKSLEEVAQDKDLVALEIELSDSDQELADEVSVWEKSKGIHKIIFKIFPMAPKVSLKFKKMKFQVFALLRAQWVKIKNFAYYLITDGKRTVLKKIKEIFTFVGNKISKWKIDFEDLPVRKKFLGIGLFLLSLATMFFIYRSLTKGVIPDSEELFIPSMASVASVSYLYDPITETEPFYDNLRSNQNLFLLKKIIVNLKRVGLAESNPMGVFEFFVEGGTPEVILEIKDREGAVSDTIQRAIEEYTFDLLESPDGKNQLCERLKKEINSILTTGTIQKVLIKNIVIKP